jgi:hypothetical protein
MTPRKDIKTAKELLSDLPTSWDGKKSILELKEANFDWRQMEWWGFYFEHLCYQRLGDSFTIPGDRYGKARSACFDMRGSINWDLKAKAIKSDDHRSILNDTDAMNWSVQEYGAHGLIIALCDVEYNDNNRTFQKWHQKLKGGKSKYEISREKRTSISRYRKTYAELKEILFLVVTPRNISSLGIHHQGRNSNGKPRPPKYMLDYDTVKKFLVDKMELKKHGSREKLLSILSKVPDIEPEEFDKL